MFTPPVGGAGVVYDPITPGCASFAGGYSYLTTSWLVQFFNEFFSRLTWLIIKTNISVRCTFGPVRIDFLQISRCSAPQRWMKAAELQNICRIILIDSIIRCSAPKYNFQRSLMFRISCNFLIITAPFFYH
jgi:hypothetical protein